MGSVRLVDDNWKLHGSGPYEWMKVVHSGIAPVVEDDDVDSIDLSVGILYLGSLCLLFLGSLCLLDSLFLLGSLGLHLADINRKQPD